ncbi:MAG: hypothetical protein ACRC33_10750 [Gemmataceae bacterium]
MARNTPESGKRTRPKTAVRGKRYRCAVCRKRSPRPVTTPAPWICPGCSGPPDAGRVGATGGPAARTT